MTINDPEAYVSSLWDWACLDGCFGNLHIKPTDVDGEVERKGNLIEIETKLPGVPIPQGQEYKFQTKVNEYGFTVVVVWGFPGNPETIELRTPHITKTYENTSLDTLRDICSKWYEHANVNRQAWVGRYTRLQSLAHLIANDEAAPEDIRQVCQVIENMNGKNGSG